MTLLSPVQQPSIGRPPLLLAAGRLNEVLDGQHIKTEVPYHGVTIHYNSIGGLVFRPAVRRRLAYDEKTIKSCKRHAVLVASSRGPEALREFATEAGATAVPVVEAAKKVEVVVVSIPQKNIPLLPKDLFAGVPDDVVIVDTGNYYPGGRDERIEEIEHGMPESVWVSKQLGRPVVKAFNTILAYSLAKEGRPAGAAGRIALSVAGDDARAKEIVIGLVEAAGFDGIDAGTLAESWRQQPGSPAYCTDLRTGDLRRALSAADKAEAPKLRDLAVQKLGQLGEGFTNEDIINTNRSLHPLFRTSAEE